MRGAGERGFSLVELLVAIAISSIIFMAMMDLLTQGAKMFRGIDKRLEMAQSGRLAMERMTRELGSGFHLGPGLVNPSPATRARPWLIIQNASDRLSFVAQTYADYELVAAPAATPAVDSTRGDLVEIRYAVKAAAGVTHLYYGREEGSGAAGTVQLNAAATDKWSGGTEQILAQNVKDIVFTAYNTAGTAIGDWNYTGSDGEANGGYPGKIRIDLTMYDPDGEVDDMVLSTFVSTYRTKP